MACRGKHASGTQVTSDCQVTSDRSSRRRWCPVDRRIGRWLTPESVSGGGHHPQGVQGGVPPTGSARILWSDARRSAGACSQTTRATTAGAGVGNRAESRCVTRSITARSTLAVITGQRVATGGAGHSGNRSPPLTRVGSHTDNHTTNVHTMGQPGDNPPRPPHDLPHRRAEHGTEGTADQAVVRRRSGSGGRRVHVPATPATSPRPVVVPVATDTARCYQAPGHDVCRWSR